MNETLLIILAIELGLVSAVLVAIGLLFAYFIYSSIQTVEYPQHLLPPGSAFPRLDISAESQEELNEIISAVKKIKAKDVGAAAKQQSGGQYL